MTGYTYERMKKGRFNSGAGSSSTADDSAAAATVDPSAAGINPHRMQDRRFQRNLTRATLIIDRFVAAEDTKMAEPSSSSCSSDDEFDEIEDESFRPAAAEIAEAEEEDEDDDEEDEEEEEPEQQAVEDEAEADSEGEEDGEDEAAEDGCYGL